VQGKSFGQEAARFKLRDDEESFATADALGRGYIRKGDLHCGTFLW
jgi:hypothetical protein